MTYYKLCLALCRWTGIGPSLLLHPLDFLGADDDLPELMSFPAMDLPAPTEVAVVSWMLDLLSRDHNLVPMREHARLARAEAG